MINKIYFRNKEDIPEMVYKHDAGVDIKAKKDYEIQPGKVELIETNVTTELCKTNFGYITGRSGLTSKGIIVLPGVIDAGYRGYLKVAILNTNKETYIVKKGERVAQLLIMIKATMVEMNIGKAKQNTDRNSNGFGSTGK
ncbi:MAG: dUTP pyrophosphatase [Thermosipho sp. (in: thermotogales)]|jgi:dUTP pyrophosphatase|nr:dUTP pyrophosphatase [Thermosipho sp. (in: thermotogales)]